MRRIATVLLIAVVVFAACGSDDDSGDEPTTSSVSTDATTTETPTTDAPTTEVPTTVDPADEAAREAAGDAVDYWLTESFYPGADISDVRDCLVDALVRDLTPEQLDLIDGLDPEHSDEQDVAAMEVAVPVIDECIDEDAFRTIAVSSFEDIGEFDAECAADVVVSEYTIGETIRDLFFGNAGADEPSEEFIALFERLIDECPLA